MEKIKSESSFQHANSGWKDFDIIFQDVSADISQAYIKEMMHVYLIHYQHQYVGCKSAISRADDSEMSDVDIIRNYINNRVSEDEQKIDLRFSNGVECYPQEAVERND